MAHDIQVFIWGLTIGLALYALIGAFFKSEKKLHGWPRWALVLAMVLVIGFSSHNLYKLFG